MRRKLISTAMIAAMMLGAVLFVGPAVSYADNIRVTGISVTVGTRTFCDTTTVVGACTPSDHIWNLGPTGILLLGNGTNQSLVLSQAQTGTTFNFDSSDQSGTVCGNTCTASLSLSINGGALLPVSLINGQGGTGNALAGRGDTGGTAFNEATDWILAAHVGAPAGSPGTNFDIFFGYVDNIHTDVCADATAQFCFPSSSGVPIFFNSATNTLLGNGVSGAGNPQSTNPNHCSTTVGTTCWDSGAILIRNTQGPVQAPEPSSLLLLGAALMGLAAWRVRGRGEKI